MTQKASTQVSEERFVIVSPNVLKACANENQVFNSVKTECLQMAPAQILVPIRLFESDTVAYLETQGQSKKEISCMKAIMENPFRLVVQGPQVLEDGRQIDNRLILFDVLENYYLEAIFNHQMQEVKVVDSYYRHNEFMTSEEQVHMENNLMKLLTRTAIVVTQYLNHESSEVSNVRVKVLKSPFLTQRQRLMKNVYKNRQQNIQQFLNVDLSIDLLTDETKVDMNQTSIKGNVYLEQSEVEVTLGASSDKAKVKTASKVARAKKTTKKETVIEVLEDGTKIVQYERAGYWRTQKNKTTGEEKKIWIEPKMMQRKIAAE